MSRTFLNGITDPRSAGVGKLLTSDASGNATWQAGPSATKVNNIWYDVVVDWGFVGDDATDNLSHWNTMIAGIPANSVVFFPPGTYRFSNVATINVDKHLQFKGAGDQSSVLKTTNTTAHLINLTGAAGVGNPWYNTFSDLGFASSVTKTAGAHISIAPDAAAPNAIGIDIRRCSFSGHFIGIDAQGAQAGNVSVWDDLNIGAPAVNGRGIRINGSTINVVISDSTINGVPNGGAIAGSANIEVNQSGAVQIFGCDLIGAVNSLLLNANQGGSTSIAAIYCDNTFFDQSGGSTVKVIGANVTNRIKFSQCGIAAGLIGTHAFEIAGTGAGAVGTATAMPAGIAIVNCDIYYAPGSSTASGILINGAQDVLIQGNRITGFSGASGCGIQAIASSPAGNTTMQIYGNRIGPNGNFTPGNTVGIQISAGAAAYGGYIVTDNDLRGSVTPIVDSGATALSGGNKVIARNLGNADGMRAFCTPLDTVTTTVEKVVCQLWAPANTLKAGTVIRANYADVPGATSQVIIGIRIGTAGSIADACSILVTGPATSVSAVNATLTGGIQSPGATAKIDGAGTISGGAATAGTVLTAGTFNSFVGNWVSLTVKSLTTNTRSVKGGVLEVISPS